MYEKSHTFKHIYEKLDKFKKILKVIAKFILTRCLIFSIHRWKKKEEKNKFSVEATISIKFYFQIKLQGFLII